MKGSKVLVVGGVGFVGSNLSRKLIDEYCCNVDVVDNLLSSCIENLPYSEDRNISRFIYGSISDDRVLMDLDKDYDYVFHMATYHGNQSSIANPLADHQHNTLTTLKLCEYFKGASNLKAMVYAGAGCTVAKKTYDEVSPTEEDDIVSLYLDSPYQISKIIGEFYGNYYFMREKLPFIKARFQNVYGPGEILGAGQWRGTPATVWRNVVPSFIFRALQNESLLVENGGIATRDFIHVNDLTDGLIASAINGEAGGVYNLATGLETPIKKLAESINNIVGSKVAIDYTPARNWDRSGKRCGATEKAEREIGFKAKISLEEGLHDTIEWTKNNIELIMRQMMQHKFHMPELNEYFEIHDAKYIKQSA